MISIRACPRKVGGLDSAGNLFELVGGGVDGLSILASEKIAVENNQLRVLVEEDQVHHRIRQKVLPPAGDCALPYVGCQERCFEAKYPSSARQALLTLTIVQIVKDGDLESPVAGESQRCEACRAFLEDAVEGQGPGMAKRRQQADSQSRSRTHRERSSQRLDRT